MLIASKNPSNDFQETFRSCADISITGRQDEELKTGRDKIQTLKKLYLLMKKSEKVGFVQNCRIRMDIKLTKHFPGEILPAHETETAED